MVFEKKFILIICVVLLTSCGYQMVGKETHVPPGLDSIAIPTFKNKTLEPGIEITFTQAFLREFILDRRVNVVDKAQASCVLEGVIRFFRIYSVSYDVNGLVLEYQTNVILDFVLKDRAGKVIWQVSNLSESAWFRSAASGLIAEANKQAAIQEAGGLVAGRIRNRFFYDF